MRDLLRAHRALLTALAVASLLRLAWVLLYPPVPVRGDDVTYLDLAQSLLSGQGYRYHGVPNTHYMPGWPLLLTLPLGLGLGQLGAKLLLVVLSTLVCWQAYLLGELLVSRRAGLFAAWFGALFPPLVWYSGVLLSETPSAAVFGLWAVFAARYACREEGLRQALVVGALGGLLVIFRAEAVVFAPLPYLARAFVSGFRAQLLPGAAGLALTLAVLSPWPIYNYHRFGERVMLTTAGGIGLINVGRTPEYGYDEYYQTIGRLQVPGRPRLTDQQITAQAMIDIRKDPWSYLRRRLTNLPQFWLGSQTEPVAGAELSVSAARQQRAYGVLAWKLVGFGTQALFALGAVAGLILFARRRDRLLPWMIVAAKMAIHAPFIQTTRYSLHLAPLLLCYAGAAVMWAVDRRRGAKDAITSGPATAANSTR